MNTYVEKSHERLGPFDDAQNIFSAGPDRAPGMPDDIGNWTQ